jgi:hypothetical protein
VVLVVRLYPTRAWLRADSLWPYGLRVPVYAANRGGDAPILSDGPRARRGWTPRGNFRYQRISLRLQRRVAIPYPGTPFGTMIVKKIATKHLATRQDLFVGRPAGAITSLMNRAAHQPGPADSAARPITVA